MSEAIKQVFNKDGVKMIGIALLSIGINFLVFNKLLAKGQDGQHKNVKTKKLNQVINQEKTQVQLINSKHDIKPLNKQQGWGSVKIIAQQTQDPLLKQLKLMDTLLFEVSRVNHLIVDLQLVNFIPNPSPLLAKKVKREKSQPFLAAQTLVSPGQFVIKQCKFTPGNTLELEKKYMRAGPRASQFFKPSDVKADIVGLGGVCPGMNTVIRQITLMLRNVYKVKSVNGVKNGFRGYYEKKFIDLTEQSVQTIHHEGGCFLGLAQCEFNLEKIMQSVIERGINQIYLIGANKTLKACHALYKQIKKKRLPIAVCVVLKGINRDVPIFDNCFGFQTAVEESSKAIGLAYSFSHSIENGISLVKLAGYNSGFLACHSVLSTVNANICLVPEFQFDIFGPHGLLAAILHRIKTKGNCTVVYAEGCENSVRDSCIRRSLKQQSTSQFDNFLKEEIEKMMKAENLLPYQIGVFNAIYSSRSAPANSFDTKLCGQIALSSILCLMAGYTNFAVGHLANKSSMISIDELIQSQSVTQLKQNSDIWQQTLMTTRQPRLLNQRLHIKS